MTSTNETSGLASVISASKKLAVALTVTVLAVVFIASVTIVIALQSKNDADDRAKQAIARLTQLENTQQCRNDFAIRVSVVTIRNARRFNALLIAIAAEPPNPEAQAKAIQDIAVTQNELDQLEAEAATACATNGQPPS